jgi:hypothetical protein
MPTGAPPSTALLRALTLVIAIMVLLRAKSVTDQAGDCPVRRGLCKPASTTHSGMGSALLTLRVIGDERPLHPCEEWTVT